MKKFLPILAFALICLVGCTKVNEVTGNYKEGTYFGAKEYESYGVKYVTTATIYVGSDGMIKTCFIDSTYTKDSVNTTKKTLGDAYGMKSASASAGNIPGGAEWYEQVKVLEDKIVTEQDLDWVKYSDDANTKIDAVSGVTITVNDYIDAVKVALDKAK